MLNFPKARMMAASILTRLGRAKITLMNMKKILRKKMCPRYIYRERHMIRVSICTYHHF